MLNMAMGSAYKDMLRRLWLGSLFMCKPCSRLLGLCSPDLPLDTGDADFLASLFVVVEPLAFGEIDSSEFSAGFCTCSKEFALLFLSMCS